jgi:hypothetical protein
MWLLAFVIYCGCKWLTWRRTPADGVPIARQVGYLAVWPGMDAVRFLALDRPAIPPPGTEWMFAAGKFSLGVAMLFGFARLMPAEVPYLVGWVGMVGIALVLHFGIFHLLSCAWRSVEVEAKPLMNWPVISVSLSEYWGRRWNTAFRDLTHRFLFRPLTPRLGARGAVLVGFAFSGVIHDIVMSWPAGGGYGGPTIFFALQGIGILAERSRMGRALGLGNGWRGWLFTMTVLLCPIGLLFHGPFVMNVVVPYLDAIGAV